MLRARRVIRTRHEGAHPSDMNIPCNSNMNIPCISLALLASFSCSLLATQCEGQPLICIFGATSIPSVKR